MFTFVFNHKKIIFIYIPLICTILLSIYTTIIYVNWRNDKNSAMRKLTQYKELIDKTEDIQSGIIQANQENDTGAKVVDLPTRIYDKNNEIIGEFFEQKREIISIKKIPQWIVKGVIASEDRNFYKHHGVDYNGIFRAFVTNIIHLHISQGGSTITQQLAKVLFTDMERSYKRKIYELFCAQEIERKYDKDDILSMYLNLIYFGNGAYGVESTSKMFFGKSVQYCNEVESSMIVATISNPLYFSPLENLTHSIRKTRRILTSLIDAGFITEARADYQYKQFLNKWEIKLNDQNEALSSLIGKSLYSNYRINRAPFFNEYIRNELSARFGEDSVKRGGLSVYTTIDGAKQDIAVSALRKGIQSQRDFHKATASKIKDPKLSAEELAKADNIEGAFISIDPYTGEIISYEGGFSLSVNNYVDHVLKGKRQPGSSFKPLVYCSAFEERTITPSTLYDDKPTVFSGNYSPKNYDSTFQGNVIVHTALVKSLNVVAVKILEDTGYDKIFSYIQSGLDLSSSDLNKRFSRTLSLALGSYEITPYEAVSLNALLINEGQFVKPYGIKMVKDYSGNIVWNAEEECKKLIENKRNEYGTIVDPSSAKITLKILSYVLKEGGTAYYAAQKNHIDFPCAGKTGTSSDYNDAWFIGYTSDSVTSVWIGNKNGSISLGKGRTGGAIAAPIWTEYASKIYHDNKPSDFSFSSDELTSVSICEQTGLLTDESSTCPKVLTDELFFVDTEPSKVCDLHKQEEIITNNTSTVQ